MTRKSNLNYRQIRSELIHRGTTLRRWASEIGWPVSTVYAAARGTRHGVRAVEIRRKLQEFINAN